MPNGWLSPSMKAPRVFGDAVAITVAPAGVMRLALTPSAAGAPHRRLHRIVEHVARRACDLRRLRDQARPPLGSTSDPARDGQGRPQNALTLRAGRRRGLLALVPAPRGRHLQRRESRPCDLGRRKSAASCPRQAWAPRPCIRRHATADRTDPRDDARKKNSGHARELPCLTGAHAIRARLACRFPGIGTMSHNAGPDDSNHTIFAAATEIVENCRGVSLSRALPP